MKYCKNNFNLSRFSHLVITSKQEAKGAGCSAERSLSNQLDYLTQAETVVSKLQHIICKCQSHVCSQGMLGLINVPDMGARSSEKLFYSIKGEDCTNRGNPPTPPPSESRGRQGLLVYLTKAWNKHMGPNNCRYHYQNVQFFNSQSSPSTRFARY